MHMALKIEEHNFQKGKLTKYYEIIKNCIINSLFYKIFSMNSLLGSIVFTEYMPLKDLLKHIKVMCDLFSDSL